MKEIDYYFTAPSPWAYLAAPRFNALVQTKALVVNWKPIDLFEVFALNGQKKVKDRPPSIQVNRLNELKRWGKFLNMEINIEPKYFPVNPDTANKFLIAASIINIDITRLTTALMTAVWVEEKDIADINTLIAIANKNGEDGRLLSELSREDRVQDRLEINTKEAIARNVFGSPTWIYQGELFWGQDRLDFLERSVGKNSNDASS